MSPAFFGRALRHALLSGVLVASSAIAVRAEQAVPQGADPAADRAADQAAIDDLQRAMAALDRHQWHRARDLLERADTALLNRQVLDLGPELRIDQPLPGTPLRQQIEQAEAALRSPDRAAAKDAVNRAMAALKADAAQTQPS